ncbi:hypothetical protein A2U01_0099902, partial [Trifolium medium]|nr:hypothetical protein [Trifolium medium]
WSGAADLLQRGSGVLPEAMVVRRRFAGIASSVVIAADSGGASIFFLFPSLISIGCFFYSFLSGFRSVLDFGDGGG